MCSSRWSPGEGMKWLKRLVTWLVTGVVCLVLVGFLWERFARHRATASYPPPGMFASVDGASIHVYCIGEGSPTVVLEAGASTASVMWTPVQSRVAEVTRVCSYDRAGLGWSHAASGSAGAEEVARRLRQSLAGVGESAPYVLAGHSMGGAYALVYQDMHPEDVVGLVLIDS